jgi:hypothetical protein
VAVLLAVMLQVEPAAISHSPMSLHTRPALLPMMPSQLSLMALRSWEHAMSDDGTALKYCWQAACNVSLMSNLVRLPCMATAATAVFMSETHAPHRSQVDTGIGGLPTTGTQV